MNKLKNRFNLKFDKSVKLTNKILYGNIEGKNISVSKEFNKRKYSLNINIYHQLDIKGEINIKKESVFSRIKKAAGNYDNVAFDEEFDNSLLLSTDHPHILTALLNQKLREKILNLAKQSAYLEITKSRLNFKIPLSFLKPDTGASSLIQLAVSVSNDMTEKKPVMQRLFENISNEKENLNVRLYNIQMLAENFPDNSEVDKFLKSLLKNGNDAVKITAACRLKEEGMEFLLEHLKNEMKNNDTVSLSIIYAFGNFKYSKAVPVLIKIFNNESYAPLRKIILDVIEKTADSSASGFLVKELLNEDNDLRDKAIKALAVCGKREAIEPLYKLGKSLFNPSVKNIIQEAISKIQSRLGTVDLGALSIAEQGEKDGALSVSNEEEKGGLSLSDDENKSKQLSQEGGL